MSQSISSWLSMWVNPHELSSGFFLSGSKPEPSIQSCFPTNDMPLVWSLQRLLKATKDSDNQQCFVDPTFKSANICRERENLMHYNLFIWSRVFTQACFDARIELDWFSPLNRRLTQYSAALFCFAAALHVSSRRMWFKSCLHTETFGFRLVFVCLIYICIILHFDRGFVWCFVLVIYFWVSKYCFCFALFVLSLVFYSIIPMLLHPQCPFLILSNHLNQYSMFSFCILAFYIGLVVFLSTSGFYKVSF